MIQFTRPPQQHQLLLYLWEDQYAFSLPLQTKYTHGTCWDDPSELPLRLYFTNGNMRTPHEDNENMNTTFRFFVDERPLAYL